MMLKTILRWVLLAALLCVGSVACLSSSDDSEDQIPEFPTPESFLVVGKTINPAGNPNGYLHVFSVEFVGVSGGQILGGDEIERFSSDRLANISNLKGVFIDPKLECFSHAVIGEPLPSFCK
jgi:hypothetical protein